MVAFIFFIYAYVLDILCCEWLCVGFASLMRIFCKQCLCAECAKITMFAKTEYA